MYSDKYTLLYISSQSRITVSHILIDMRCGCFSSPCLHVPFLIQVDPFHFGDADLLTSSSSVMDSSPSWNTRGRQLFSRLHLVTSSHYSSYSSFEKELYIFQQGLQCIEDCCVQVSKCFDHAFRPFRYCLTHSVNLAWPVLAAESV